MKSKITLLLLFVIVVSAQAQLRITEIMYDPPESGTDSLEYVELYNSSDVAIDLTGYIMEDNNAQDTIPSGTLMPGAYVLTAVNAGAVQTVLGVTAISTPNVAYRNTGELIMVKDPQGNILDMVDYSDTAPWPTFADGTDGGGASIELCNLEASGNNGANWRAADNDLGITLNDRDIKGTPGAANTTTCGVAADITANLDNTFTPADITINVGETLTWANTGGFHNVNGSQETFPDNPESFETGFISSELWTFQHTFTIVGVYDYRCDPHAPLGMSGTVTVLGEPEPMFPSRTIAEIEENDADGRAILLDSLAEVVGVAHGINFNANGLQFSIIDEAGDGIGVFSGDDNFGIMYEEGMELKVGGRVNQFNGLTQIRLEAAEVLSTGNTLVTPEEVSVLDEDTESQLVTIATPLTFDPGDWTGSGSGFNVDMTDGTNTYTIRIDNDSELYSMPAPNGPIVVTGIGGQFDSSSPFLQGYQLFPRYASDIQESNSTVQEVALEISIYPNPVTNKLFIKSEKNIDKIEVRNISGQLIYATNGTDKIDVSGLSHGMYILNVTVGDIAKSLQFTK